MAEIPQFSPRQAIPIVTDTARADPNALALPGLEAARQGQALEQAGARVEELGSALGVLQHASDVSNANAISADATVKWHDTLQNAMDEARKSGDFTDFTKNLRTQLDSDLGPRLENATPGARNLLTPHFAELTNQITSRAADFEHRMQNQASIAGLGDAFDKFGLTASRDPSMAPDLMRQGADLIKQAQDAGYLNPEQARHQHLALAHAIWPGALIGHAASDPHVLTDFNAGKYDEFLTPEMKLALKPHLEAAATKGILGGLAITPGAGGSGGAGGSTWEIRNNNFGGLRKPGVNAGPSQGGFQSFATPEEGVQAIDSQIQRYYQGATTGRPITTLRGIVSTWAPPSENDTATLIARAAKVTGFDPDQPLVLDAATRAKLIEATIRNEQGGRLPIDPAIITKVTGAAPPANAAEPTSTAAPAEPGGNLAALYRRIDQMGLDPDLALKVKAGARVNYDALEADQARQQRLQEKAQLERVRGAEDKIVADAYSGNPQITAQQVANDPAFADHPDARLRMIQVVRSAGEAGPAAGPSHIATLDLIRRVNLPDGDPQKITDRTPLLDALGSNTISKADFDFAEKELKEAAAPFAADKKNFLHAIEPQIDRSAFAGFPDLEGKQRFYEYQRMLDDKIEEYRKAGKNPGDLLRPSSPDYMGKPEAIEHYKGPLQKLLQDAPKPGAAADLSSQAGIVAAYKAGNISREEASRRLIAGGFAAAPGTAQPQPQAPLR